MKKTLISQYRVTGQIAALNLAGVGADQCRISPSGGGNGFNWVLGHLTDTYNRFLPIFGQEQIWTQGEGDVYTRGSLPLIDDQGLAWAQLLQDWEHASSRFLVGLEEFSESRWHDKAPFSPLNDPQETLGSLLSLLVFHQAYHVGQLGLLRKIVGLETAVR